MDTRVIYSTEAFDTKNNGNAGIQSEGTFSSLEEAKAAPMPPGCTFAFIPTTEGNHIYSLQFGWEFFKTVD